VIAALNDSYRLFRPGEVPMVGDVRRAGDAYRRRRIPRWHPARGAVSGVRAGVQPRAWHPVAADAQMQVFFVGMPLSIMIGFLILLLVVGAMMGGFLGYVEGVLRELAPVLVS